MSYNARDCQRISSSIYFLVCLFFSAVALTGCQAPECAQMDRCCAAIQQVEGVGEACGEMTASVDTPQACRAVVSAAQAMFEERDEALPEACAVAGDK